MGATAPTLIHMKIQLKTSIASADWSFAARDVVEVDDSLAEKWIESGIAVAVQPAVAHERAVMPVPETPESPAPKSRKK